MTTNEGLLEYWTQRRANALHGHLLSQNSFFSLLQSQKIFLFHVTTNLPKILERGLLFSSVGCLVGSVYCTPLFPENRGLRSHNLGNYIFQREVRRSLAAQQDKNKPFDSLIIEVSLDQEVAKNIAGVDYLGLGGIHFDAYHGLRHLLLDDALSFEQNIVRKIRDAGELIEYCHSASRTGRLLESNRFFELVSRSISSLSILGYLLFEALTEYIMLFSRDRRSIDCADRGEINTWGYKEFAFGVEPSLLRNFNLGNFNPNLDSLLGSLQRFSRDEVISIDAESCVEYVQHRFIFFVNYYLLNSQASIPKISQLKTFRDMCSTLPDLVGHTIDREIRKHKRYGDFVFQLDSLKARQIWRYWASEKYLIPFNGTIPKGEVGINPSRSDSYKVYSASTQYRDQELYLTPQKCLDIRVVPELVGPSLSCMGLKFAAA